MSEGALESADHGVLSGWVRGLGGPPRRRLSLWVDGRECGIVVARGPADGPLRFQHPLPERFRDGQPHEILLRTREGETVLDGTPLRLTLDPAANPVGEGPLEGALRGREGWWYLCRDSNDSIGQYRGELRLSPTDLRRYQLLLEGRQRHLRRRRPYLLFTVPGKEWVYPEFLPEGLLRSPLARPAEQLQAMALSECPGLTVVDLLPVLLAGKEREPLYFRTDSHWNHAGAFVAARALITQVRAFFPAVPPLLDSDLEWLERPFDNGDLRQKNQFALQGADGWQPLPHQDPGAETQRVPRPRAGRRARRLPTPAALQRSPTRETWVLETGLDTLPSCVMFRDSFSDWLIWLLAEHFRRIVFVWQSAYDAELVDAEAPDLVLHQVAERFLIRLPER
ncbi:MAG TPA: hypothetical protein VFV27_08070 [Nevskiaceae bacterium]|nr:hypothetical protein [Nevskiaceae bacterium]